MNKPYDIKWLLQRRGVRIFLVLLLLISLLDIFIPPPGMPEYSKQIYSEEGTLLTAYLTPGDKWRLRTNLNEVSPELIKAILSKEDKWFYVHPGVNPAAITRALFTNIAEGRRVSGASTITMQLARMLEPAERTYANKLIEVIRAIQIELHYGKDEILEMYLSLLPYGGNIEGVKSASYIYFNRKPEALSLAQTVALTIIPNDPNGLRLDKQNIELVTARNEWLNRFKDEGVFTQADVADALEEPLIPARYEMPKLAPHFTNRMAGETGGEVIGTTLSLNIQNKAENLLKNYVNRAKARGVTNGAVLVIDNKTMEVKAYCGSADFYDDASSGQVDGVQALRSPGSTLKTALYAQAFNKGILTPKMKLLDIPTDFGGYEPENYDLEFNGPVTVDEALKNSLNIPAVRLLSEVGLNEFTTLLSDMHLSDITKRRSQLGLSLILGGCGVTLEELTRMYTTFANGGVLNQLRYNRFGEQRSGKEVLGEEACYLVSGILANNERPDFPTEYLHLTKLPKVAWKTGTSYGKRDAWAIGYNKRYTIGVWMGNFDGKGSPYLSGAEMAVPLMFELFNAIDTNPQKDWFTLPGNLLERKVCSETGLLVSGFCEHTVNDYYIKDVTNIPKCGLYEYSFVSEDEAVEYCTDCLPVSGYKRKAYPKYQPELVHWFNANNIGYDKPPEHNRECKHVHDSEGLVILSPSEGYEYYLEKGKEEKILLQAATDNTGDRVHWYVNGEFVESALISEKVFYQPTESKLIVNCVDDKGRQAEIKINVKYY